MYNLIGIPKNLLLGRGVNCSSQTPFNLFFSLFDNQSPIICPDAPLYRASPSGTDLVLLQPVINTAAAIIHILVSLFNSFIFGGCLSSSSEFSVLFLTA